MVREGIAAFLVETVAVAAGGLVGVVGGNDFQEAFEAREMRGGVAAQVDEDLVVRQVGAVVGGQDDGRLRGQRVAGHHVRQEILLGKAPERLVQLLQFGAVGGAQYQGGTGSARLAHQTAHVGDLLRDVAVKVDSGHPASIVGRGAAGYRSAKEGPCPADFGSGFRQVSRSFSRNGA